MGADPRCVSTAWLDVAVAPQSRELMVRCFTPLGEVNPIDYEDYKCIAGMISSVLQIDEIINSIGITAVACAPFIFNSPIEALLYAGASDNSETVYCYVAIKR